MATYVNDLRLTELATGEGSGTWGTTTNTNLELIGEALGYGTQDCFTTDADATTTVADGATDPARAMYFKVTSSATLTATRTLTIAPNTVSRVMWIENATTGSQSIAISQGSGANVTIATGKAAVVYLDGAGATAAVVDAMNLVDPGVTDTLAEVLTAGNATGGTDIAVGTGDDITFANNSKAIFGGSTELQIYYEAGASVNLIESPTYNIQIGANAIDFTSYAGTSYATIDSSGISLPDSAKAIFGAGSDLQIYHDGSASYISDSGTGNLFIEGADNVVLRSQSTSENFFAGITNAEVRLYYNGVQKFATTNTGADVTGTVTADGLTVETTQGDISIANSASSLNFARAGTSYIRATDASGSFRFITGANDFATSRLNLAANGDVSFYEDTGTTAKFFWDASAEALGIGTTSPNRALDVQTSSEQIIATFGTGNTTQARLSIADANTTTDYVGIGADTDDFTMFAGGSECMRIEASGQVGIGTSTIAETLVLGSADSGSNFLQITNSTTTAADNRGFYVGIDANEAARLLNRENTDMVFGTNNTTQMTLDSSGNLGIGTSSPDAPLHISQPSTGTAIVRLEQTDTTLVADQAVGVVEFEQNDAAGAGVPAKLGAYAEDANAAVGLRFYTGTGATANERMRIDSSGNVGIGTSSPTTPDGSNADNSLNGIVQTIYGSSPAINLIDNAGTGYSLINFGRLGASTNPYRASIGYDQANDQLVLAAYNEILFKDGNLNSATERARIDSSGNLLVGVTTNTTTTSAEGFVYNNGGSLLVTRDGAPAAYFTRLSSDGDIAVFRKGSTTVGSIGSFSGSKVYIGSPSSAGAVFSTNGVMPVTDGSLADNAHDLGQSSARWKDLYLSGNVLVGTTTASAKLTVEGSGSAAQMIRGHATNASYTGQVIQALASRNTTNESYEFLRCSVNGVADRLKVYDNGNVENTNNSYGSLSDIKLKENVVDASAQWDDIKGLRFRKYNFKEETGQSTHTQMGLIAQEAELVCPGIVKETTDRDQEGNDLGTTTKSIQYSLVYVKAVKALQEAMARIETLEAEVAALKGA